MERKHTFIRLLKAAVKETDLDEIRNKKRDATKILVPFRMMLHPLGVSSEIKWEGRGSLGLANLIALLYLICGVLRGIAYGFVFNSGQAENFNLWPIFVQTLGILFLWLVSSWAISSLMDGEGKLSEIWITVCYSMMPTILLTVPAVILSNVAVQEEAALIGLLESVMTLWSVVLLAMSTLVIQQYTLRKTIGTIFLTLLGMASIVFLLIMFFSLFQQLYIFLDTVFREVLMRM